jgi:hypothetical protein
MICLDSPRPVVVWQPLFEQAFQRRLFIPPPSPCKEPALRGRAAGSVSG